MTKPIPKLILMALGCAGFCLSANADVLTPEQALNRAVISPAPVGQMQLMLSKDYKLTQTVEAEGLPVYYVFNATEGGFVVASADDAAAPKLGYSDEGTLDVNTMPETLKAWLDEYARQIEWARSQQAAPTFAAAERTEHDPIEPLVTTKWGQNSPFNNLLPSTSYATGCVATAMAQIMYYHKWPATGMYCEGIDSCSYTSNSTKVYDKLDFTEVTFDWDNMLEVYGSDATEEQQNAVALLMKACGYAAQMAYSTSSSSNGYKAAKGLVHHLRYSKNITYIERSLYNLYDWENIVYEQLLTGPVYYRGVSNSAGHAFVCDGYQGEGYFHFNWGWTGSSNGYFLLSACDPKATGTGGGTTTDGYKYDQAILAYLLPAAEDEQPVKPEFRCKTLYIDETQTPALGETFYTGVPGSSSAAMMYLGNDTIRCKFGVKIIDADGEFAGYALAGTVRIGNNQGKFAPEMTLPEELPVGTYTLTPLAYLTDYETFVDVPVPHTGVQSATMEVLEDNTVKFTNGTVETIEVTDFEFDYSFLSSTNVKVTMTINNPTDFDFFDKICLATYDSEMNQETVSSGWVVESIMAGETGVVVKGSMSFSSLTTDTYTVAVVTGPLGLESAPRRISDFKEIFLVGADKTQMRSVDWRFYGNLWSSAPDTYEEYYEAYEGGDPNNLTISFKITPASATYYVDDVYLRIYTVTKQDATTGKPTATSSSAIFSKTYEITPMMKGDTITLTDTFKFDSYDTDAIYLARFLYYNRYTGKVSYISGGQRLFKLADPNYDITDDGVNPEPYTQNYDVEGVSLTYDRTFESAEEWQPLYIPFDMSYEEWSPYVQVAYLSNVRTDNNEVVLEFETAKEGKINPHVPYIIKPLEAGQVTIACEGKQVKGVPASEGFVSCSSTSQVFTVYGTYAEKSGLAAEGSYVLSCNWFEKAQDETTVAPYRFYLNVTNNPNNPYANSPANPSAPDRIAITVDGETSSVIGIEMDQRPTDGIYYDLLGRPVSNPSTGVYILNGKKIYLRK